ncbi:hypothetical protein [Azotobacter chroococcum]|uniref:hypothetical protein n=1 Tax=Azotobacter chroococcum TaxID=353 RepID=UPI000584D33F|nr:hypothetical protein [Azotobacter chroococcum]
MSIDGIAATVCIVGAFGGIINCAIADEFVLPKIQMKDSGRVWRPGWIGNVLIGAITAVAIWALYGPLASYDLASPDNSKQLTLTLSQLLASGLTGMGGGNILTQLAERNSNRLVKENLVDTIKDSTKTKTTID